MPVPVDLAASLTCGTNIVLIHCRWGNEQQEKTWAAESHTVSSADHVTDSYLPQLDPALPLWTCKLEPGDDGNRK